jgi:glucose-1-phosphate thymidylyltransferase
LYISNKLLKNKEFLDMKGIILAGGAGTRLYPITKSITKQLLPIYDKPLIYYPLSILMLAGIREILIISTPQDLPKFEALFGDGSELGLKFSYKVQVAPKGIAEAFIIGEEFIGNDSVCLILGDNLYYGEAFPALVKKSIKENTGATVFGYYVKDPERYGVVEFDEKQKVVSIEEKPKIPKSNYAVTGLYIYNNQVVEIAKNLKPSARGEIEITDVNNKYQEQKALKVQLMGRGVAWLDTGTFQSLLEAGEFIKVIQERQGLNIACIEEIAFRNEFINKKQFEDLITKLPNNPYSDYLKRIIK